MPTARIATESGVRRVEYTDGRVRFDGESHEVAGTDGIDLLPPTEPSCLYCLGRNYPAYVEENADTIEESLSAPAEIPDEVHFFLKSPSCIIGPDDPLPYPSFSGKVGYGGELAAVIDRSCKNVEPSAVPNVVRGYTIMNDIDAKDQATLIKMKVFDGSAPLGPAIGEVDPAGLSMRTKINGEVRQEANTADMHYDPGQAIAAISERITLKAGDVVALGSPANPGTVEPGDVIEVCYEDIGTLRTPVIPPA